MNVTVISYVKQVFFDCGHHICEFDRQLNLMPTKVTCVKEHPTYIDGSPFH